MTTSVSTPRQIDILLTAAEQAQDALVILERLMPDAIDQMFDRFTDLKAEAEIAADPETKARLKFEADAAFESFGKLVSADSKRREAPINSLQEVVTYLYEVAHPAPSYEEWKEGVERMKAYKLPDVVALDPFKLFAQDLAKGDDAGTLTMPPIAAKPYRHHVAKNDGIPRLHSHVVYPNVVRVPRPDNDRN